MELITFTCHSDQAKNQEAKNQMMYPVSSQTHSFCPKIITRSEAQDPRDSLGTGPTLEHYFHFLATSKIHCLDYEPMGKKTSVKETTENRKTLLHVEL